MTTKEIAARLVELCRKGEFENAQKELFATDAVSIEPFEAPGFPKVTRGLNQIIEKGHKFQQMVKETHSITVSEPLVAGNSIALTMNLKLTMKERGPQDMSEICVYQLKGGKIISEEFHV